MNEIEKKKENKIKNLYIFYVPNFLTLSLNIV